MGNGADFFLRGERGRHFEYVYLAPAKNVNYVKGHLIKRKGDKDTYSNLPLYSNTSDVYFRKNEHGVCQARVYIGNKTVLDFDWSHTHSNKGDGKKFERGTVHVQEWKQNKDGTFCRISDARCMSNAEIKKYGALIKAFCPNVKYNKAIDNTLHTIVDPFDILAIRGQRW